jgi:hypothetical protein
MTAPANKATASKTLAEIANLLNKMTGIADDKLSQIAGEDSDEAARDALLVAINDLDDQMLRMRDLITRGYSVASCD